MSYDTFLEEVKDKLQSRFASDMPEKYSGVQIGIRDVEKLQGESYRGISIRNGASNVEANMNLQAAYEQHERGASLDDIVQDLAQRISEMVDHTPKLDVQSLTDYESMKSHLMLQLIPQKGNEKKLSDIPHEKVEDMAMIYRLDLGTSDHSGGQMTTVVTNEMLRSFGITAEQLHQDAMEIAPKNHPASLRSMQEVMAEMMGMDIEDAPPDPAPLLVATVEGSFMGASVIQYPGFMEQATEKIGGDFFVLPSSIHEVLLLPDDGNADFHELSAMVQSINESQVAPAERLSDNVYHYDSKDHVFELADKTEARKLAKERSDTPEKKTSVLAQLGEKKKEAMEHAPKAKAPGRTVPEAAL